MKLRSLKMKTMHRYMKGMACSIIALTAVALTAGCNLEKEVLFSGMTMGTVYHVRNGN